MDNRTVLLGYARVSTSEQDLALQTDALEAAGCGHVFTDHASGARADRPGLDALLRYARPGDTVVVWKLDRLGRSLPHLIDTVRDLAEQGIGFRSLTEQIDTTTPGGKFTLALFAALAELERDLIRERTMAGLAAARARGRVGGRPVALSPARLAQARILVESGEPVAEVARSFGVGRSTLYNALRPKLTPTA